MGTIGTALKLILGCEDSLGKVLAGSTGQGAKTLFRNAEGKGLKKVANFIHLTDKEVKLFDQSHALASDLFSKSGVDKKALKAIQKDGKNFKSYSQKIVEMFKASKAEGGLTKGKVAEIFGDSIKNPEAIEKAALKAAETETEAVAKTGLKGLGSKIGKAFKGKGGTIGIALTALFELPTLIQAFKNGDGAQQVGRSSFNIAGGAAGAALGAAIGSVIPVAGTAIGGAIGLLAGIIGSIAGYSLADKAGTALFGKSIEAKKEEAAEKTAEQQEALASQYKVNTLA